LRYGLGIPPTQAITKRDLASSSPFNTRRFRGLPPTPIADPGPPSMQDAAPAADREPRPRLDAGRRPSGEGRLPLLRAQARLPQPLLHGEHRGVRQLHSQGPDQLLTGRTTLVGLIGNPVEHSVSPAMHNAAFAARGLDWAYVPLPVDEGRVEDAVRGLVALGFAGAN